MIVFDSIAVKNFLSVGNKPITLNYVKGIHYLTGLNTCNNSRNGVGKSLISSDALTFALFGKSLRKSKVSDLINSKNKRECVVVLRFHINSNHYIIERGINPSNLKFTNERGIEIELSSKKDTQQVIEDVTSLSFETFKNMIAMNVNSAKGFMSMAKKEKRELLEQVLSIDVVGNMYRLITEDFNKVNNDLKIHRNTFDLTKKNYESSKVQNEQIKKSIQEHDSVIAKKVEVVDLEIKNKYAEYENIKSIEVKDSEDLNRQKSKLLKDQENVLEFLNGCKVNISNFEFQLKSLNSQKNDIINAGDKCPTCQNDITPEHRDSELKKIEIESQKINVGLVKLRENCIKLSDMLNSVKSKILDIDSEITKSVNKSNKLNSLKELLKTLIKNKEDIKNSNITIKELDLESINKEFEDASNKLDDVSDRHKHISVLKSIFSDEGIKSYVIKNVLPMFNEKFKDYCERLGSDKLVQFDENLDELEKINGKSVLSYSNFSAGEQKRIDLALLLTFIDIARMQGKTCTNLLILDDLLHGAMDSGGMEEFLTILKEKAIMEDMCIFNVSHSQDYDANFYNSIIILEKDEYGFTNIKDIF